MLEDRVVPALSVVGLSSVSNPADLATILLGPDVTISNVNFQGFTSPTDIKGASSSAGSFSGGLGTIGFDSGIILSTGGVQGVVGPNEAGGTTQDNGLAGDADLDTLLNFDNNTYDATYLEFDFVPAYDTISFQYVFSSEEYNEYANSLYNDVFAFFLNGQNIALLPNGDPVSINNVNGGNPFGTNPKNPNLFINNENGTLDTEMDGLTVVFFTVQAQVTPNQVNHIKLAIADVGDSALDSNVFIRAASFSSLPSDVKLPTHQDPEDGDFVFQLPAAPVTPVKFDPDVAVGYDYEVLSGPNFATVELPTGIGDNQYTMYIDTNPGAPGIQIDLNAGIPLTGGVQYTFPTGGVNGFQIKGIETSAMLNPANPAAFITLLSFVNSNPLNFTMTPLTVFVPDTTAPNVTSVNVPAAGLTGQKVDFTGAFTDAETAETHTAVINWGDGTTSPALITENAGAGTAIGSHVYLTPGSYQVTLIVTDSKGGVSSGGPTDTITITGTAKKSFTYTDTDGDIYTVKLTGPGTLAVAQNADANGKGPIASIAVKNTNAKSSIVDVTVKKAATGNGFVSLAGFQANGGLLAFKGAAVDLNGEFNLPGLPGSVTVHDIKAGTKIIAGGDAKDKSSITAHVVETNVTITVGTSLTSFTAASVGAGSKLTAPTIGTFKITGDKNFKIGGVLAPIAGNFLGDLTLTGSGNPKIPTSLSTASIAGQMNNSDWTITGNVGSISAAVTSNTTINVTGKITTASLGTVSATQLVASQTITSVLAKSWAGGKITAKTLGSLKTTAGGFGSVDLTLTGSGDPKAPTSLSTASIAGPMNISNWTVTGNIGSISAVATANATINVTGKITTANLGTVSFTQLVASETIGSVLAKSWTGGQISAKTLSSLKTTAGGFNSANLNLIGSGNPKAPTSLGSASIAGTLISTTWFINGDSGAITNTGNVDFLNLTIQGKLSTLNVGAVGQAIVNVNKAITTLITKGWTSGQLTAVSVNTFTINGNLGANVTLTGVGVGLGKPVLNMAKVTGIVQNTTIDVTGLVISFTAGSFVDSKMYVGYDPTINSDPLAGGIFTPGSELRTFSVTGDSAAFANSYVGATKVGTATIKSAVTNNGGTTFGFIVSQSVKKVSVGTPSFVYNSGDPSPASIGDFKVNVISAVPLP